VALPDATRQALRAAADRLFRGGVSRAEAARILGVSRATTTRWHRMWGSPGSGVLLATRPKGRPPRLGPRELAVVDRALLRGPRAWGYDLDRWSLAATAALVTRLTGKRHHRRHIGRLLRRMGWVIPPVGRFAGSAFRRREFRDGEGNALALFERRGRPRHGTSGTTSTADSRIRKR